MFLNPFPVFSESLPLFSRPGTPSTNDLPQADIAQDPESVEPPLEPASVNAPEPEAIITEVLMAESIIDFELVDHADNTEFIESDFLLRDPAAESQEADGPSPLAKPITSFVVVLPTLPPPVEETQSPMGYIPPPVIDSTAGNPGAFTDFNDDLLQPDIAQDPQAVAVAPITLNASEPEDPVTITEELVDEPTSYFGGPMAESIKDFELVDHADSTAELSEGVHGNIDDISTKSHHKQNGETAQYYRCDVIPTTEEVVPDNANNVVLPEQDLGHREETPVEALHDDAVLVERERQEEPQQKLDPILIPDPAPNYDVPSYRMNLGSEREVWAGEQDHSTYPSSSVPVVNSSSEDVKWHERSPAPSIRFVDFYYPFFLELNSKFKPSSSVPFTDPFADPIAPRIPVSQPVLDMSQYVNLGLQPYHLRLLIDVYRPEIVDNYQQEAAETHSHGPIIMSTNFL